MERQQAVPVAGPASCRPARRRSSARSTFSVIASVSSCRPGPGTGDHQRHVDVGVEGGQLARHQPVLAGVQPVVGAEHDVGVAQQVPLSPAPPRSAAIMSSTDCTDWARRRKARLIAADLTGGQRRVAGQPPGRVGGQRSKLGGGGRQPGNRWASRGAGVYGVCGAKVASSRKNGCADGGRAVDEAAPRAGRSRRSDSPAGTWPKWWHAAVIVHLVVELAVAPAGDVPLVPALAGRRHGGHRRSRAAPADSR